VNNEHASQSGSKQPSGPEQASAKGKPSSAAQRDFLARQRGVFDPVALLEGLQRGDRNSLARALTLVESEKPEHRQLARQVLEACLRESTDQTRHRTLRIGITGVPGVGKSTFIESLGMMLVGAGHRVGVMAVDPSSEKSGGSILGDKTRMEKLAAQQAAFIRPSPARGTLGGVADRTREHILLFEAAGYDTVLVETVGVGQSETAVHGMVDCFLLLLLPGAGDELQGIKRGIVEMADLLVVNKSDGDNEKRALETQRDYERALHLFPPTESGWLPPVLRCSATVQNGMDQVLEKLLAFRDAMHAGGHFALRRQEQAGSWLHEALRDGLTAGFYAHPSVRKLLNEEERVVRAGQVHPLQAAERLLSLYRAL
jgi:LAO/AO transport system kinase